MTLLRIVFAWLSKNLKKYIKKAYFYSSTQIECVEIAYLCSCIEFKGN